MSKSIIFRLNKWWSIIKVTAIQTNLIKFSYPNFKSIKKRFDSMTAWRRRHCFRRNPHGLIHFSELICLIAFIMKRFEKVQLKRYFILFDINMQQVWTDFFGADVWRARVLIPMKQTKSAWSDNWLIVHSKVFAVQRHKKSSLMTQTQTLFGFCDAWDCSDLWMIIIIWKFEWMLMQVLEKTLVRLNSLEHFSSFSGRKAIHLQWHYSWNAYLVQNFWIDVVLTV